MRPDLNQPCGLTVAHAIDIRKELECLIEAQAELLNGDNTNVDRALDLHSEINARAWAAHYIVSYPDAANRPENYADVLARASMYDSTEPIGDEVVQ
jgi:hypothetical protein